MNLIASSRLIVVIGLGVTGMSIVRYLQNKKMPFLVMDTREQPPGLDELKQHYPDVKVMLGELDAQILMQAEEMIVSPGLSLKTPAIAQAMANGVKAIGDIELFAREIQRRGQQRIIAITGSNAKTTVTTLVGEIAKDAGVKSVVAGNIGQPVLDLLKLDIDLFILELSSFQLETTHSLNADVATVLNISLDHMDRYTGLAEYHRAKQRIYFGAKKVVVNRADPLTQPPLAEGVERLSFGLTMADRAGFGLLTREGKEFLAYEFTPLLSIDELQLRGRHNIANCLAALALGYAAGIAMDTMLATIKRFEGLPHRCQLIATIDGVEYINDSKATNIGATLAALEGFKQATASIILIAGGDGKGADFSELSNAVNQTVKLLVLIGRDASLIDAAINNEVERVFAEDLKAAICLAKSLAQKGDVVLLSPACASFDMFSGYEERGQVFVDTVLELAA